MSAFQLRISRKEPPCLRTKMLVTHGRRHGRLSLSKHDVQTYAYLTNVLLEIIESAGSISTAPLGSVYVCSKISSLKESIKVPLHIYVDIDKATANPFYHLMPIILLLWWDENSRFVSILFVLIPRSWHTWYKHIWRSLHRLARSYLCPWKAHGAFTMSCKQNSRKCKSIYSVEKIRWRWWCKNWL